MGHAGAVTTNPEPPLPTALVTDLDLATEAGREQWEHRLMSLATQRLAQARERLLTLAVIDADGEPKEPPPAVDGSAAEAPARTVHQ